jgi:hypothetical protein
MKSLFSAEEDRIITDSFREGLNDHDTQGVLAKAGFTRSKASVNQRRNKLGLFTFQKKCADLEGTRLSGNQLFAMAMIRAINSGAETAFMGTIKDKRPIKLSRADRPETFVPTCSPLCDA